MSLIDLAATIESLAGETAMPAESDWSGRPLQSFIDNPDAGRAVISEYHDGGSPCGVYLLRKGPWKYQYFAEASPALLFNIENDPQECVNLAEDPQYLEVLNKLRGCLFDILDPEEVNRQAFADQALMIEKLGGKAEIEAMQSFNHTPLEPA